jgi:hypothetical protein
MDQVLPGLWIGDLPSALNVKELKDNNIYSILSAMRGRVTVNEVRLPHFLFNSSLGLKNDHIRPLYGTK